MFQYILKIVDASCQLSIATVMHTHYLPLVRKLPSWIKEKAVFAFVAQLIGVYHVILGVCIFDFGFNRGSIWIRRNRSRGGVDRENPRCGFSGFICCESVYEHGARNAG
jgi:hypothetical protein